MSDDYGYINARIRAMKSFLLKGEDYQEALRQRSQDELVSFLSSLAAYAHDFRQVSTGQPARFVCDEALKLNMCRIFRKIIRFSEGEPNRLILIILMPWDIYNLKTIIRGILNHKDKSEIIPALIPAGKWNLEFLSRLAEAKDLKTLAGGLVVADNADLEKEFAGLIKDYSQDSPLELLEHSLTEVYFKRALEFLSGANINERIVLDYLSLRIDFLNIPLVLKKVIQADTGLTGFIKGGKLSIAFLESLIQLKSIEDTLKIFEQSPYPWLSQEGLYLFKHTKRLSSLEKLLRNKLFSFCSHLYTGGDPLSIGIPLAFINFKESEMTNLRLISQGIFFEFPKDLLRGEMIFAG